MPHVIVKLWPGKAEQQKQKIAQEITQRMMRQPLYREEAVSVAFEEIETGARAGKVCRADIFGNGDNLHTKPGDTL